jgi:GYF domain 2
LERKVIVLDRQRQIEELPSEVQWYVLVGEQEYGPIRFSHLAQLAMQGRLLKDNFIWKPGFSSWTAAAEVPGLFFGLALSCDDPAQINRYASVVSETPALRRDLKERARAEIKNFSLFFLYLWVVFGMLAIHESIILAQHGLSYISHGVALVNALIFAKVMLVAQDLHLGHRLDDKPLVYSILFKSFLFGITLICFHIIEHVLIGMWHGTPVTETISEVGVDNLEGLISIGTITTVALVPFFILREISRVIGEGKLWALFFQRRSV